MGRRKKNNSVTVKNPTPIPRTAKAAREKGAPADAYRIDMHMPDYHGEDKMVKFTDGVGMFSRDIFRAAKSGWFDRRTGEQTGGPKFELYVQMWRDRGATVTPIKAKAAVTVEPERD